MKSTRIISLLILLLLVACAPGGGLLSVPTATSTEVRASETPTLATTAIPPTATATIPPTPRLLAERVLIISFDGLRPDTIGKHR